MLQYCSDWDVKKVSESFCKKEEILAMSQELQRNETKPYRAESKLSSAL